MKRPSQVFDLCGKRLYVAGDTGMVGSALVRRLAREPVKLLTVGRSALDLTRQADVEAWMQQHKPHVVILAAARVGGILANATRPVEFLEDNLLIELNLIRSAHALGVEKLLFLGSSCIYPRDCPQPIREDYLLTGPLEPTNAAYALAKIAGVEICRAYHRQYGADFISAMPTNLYGPGDHFDLTTSHVIPALIRKVHEAKLAGAATVEVWGTGTPRREFLHVDDLADACVWLLAALFLRPPGERRQRGRGHDSRACHTGRSSCWLSRGFPLRSRQTRRRTPQTARHDQARSSRLAPQNHAGGGPDADLPLVFGPSKPKLGAFRRRPERRRELITMNGLQ